MIRRLAVLLVIALAAAGMAYAESYYNAVSATDTNGYLYFNGPRSSVMICNTSTTDAVYFRLFNQLDTPAAATTAYSWVGTASSATQPNCIGFSKPPTSPAYYAAASFIMASTKTATVAVYSE